MIVKHCIKVQVKDNQAYQMYCSCKTPRLPRIGEHVQLNDYGSVGEVDKVAHLDLLPKIASGHHLSATIQYKEKECTVGDLDSMAKAGWIFWHSGDADTRLRINEMIKQRDQGEDK